MRRRQGGALADLPQDVDQRLETVGELAEDRREALVFETAERGVGVLAERGEVVDLDRRPPQPIGEEPREEQRRVADLLRAKLEETPVRWNNIEVPVTASFGLTGALPGELDVKAMIGRADAALYRAKHTGRNRICSAEGAEALA